MNLDKINNINTNFTIQSNDSRNIKNKSKSNPMYGVNKDLVKCDKLIFGPVFNEKNINFLKYYNTLAVPEFDNNHMKKSIQNNIEQTLDIANQKNI